MHRHIYQYSSATVQLLLIHPYFSLFCYFGTRLMGLDGFERTEKYPFAFYMMTSRLWERPTPITGIYKYSAVKKTYCMYVFFQWRTSVNPCKRHGKRSVFLIVNSTIYEYLLYANEPGLTSNTCHSSFSQGSPVKKLPVWQNNKDIKDIQLYTFEPQSEPE